MILPAAHRPPSGSTAGAVLTKATLRAAGLLGLNNAVLARVVGLSEAQVSRLAHGHRELQVGTKEAELAALLIRVYRSLDALVGNDARLREAWMASFNQAFNQTPREAIQGVEGLVRVVAYLDGARALA